MSIPTDQRELREIVRAKYAAAATVSTGENTSAAACCGAEGAIVTEEQRAYFGSSLYESGEREELPEPAVLASLGCGNPIAIAELHEGETVLDLGSGGGIDVLLSARRVGPTGLAYGLDMTDEMLDLARRNQAQAGVTNVQWLRGHIEEIPLPRDTVDVIISNCVINLSGDKPQVLREAARVLKPGGRFAISDVIADDDMDDDTRADMQAYTGCIAGALTRDAFTEALQAAGLTNISITETHRVHAAAISAIVRATKPGDETEENKQLVRRLVEEAVGNHNLNVLDQIAAGPFAEVATRWVAPFQGAFPDFTMEIVELIAEGEKVVAHFRCSGTHRGEWLGVPPTGRRFENVDEVYIFEIREGRLVAALGVEDNLSRLSQLGILHTRV